MPQTRTPVQIRRCGRHGSTRFYREKAKTMRDGVIWRCRACRTERQAEQRRRRKERLVEFFGGVCQKCGYDRCIRALDFHHPDPSQKEFGIGKYLHRRWEVLVAEASKCELLCKNCHYETEDEMAAERRSATVSQHR
jgi:hypothetical protein